MFIVISNHILHLTIGRRYNNILWQLTGRKNRNPCKIGYATFRIITRFDQVLTFTINWPIAIFSCNLICRYMPACVDIRGKTKTRLTLLRFTIYLTRTSMASYRQYSLSISIIEPSSTHLIRLMKRPGVPVGTFRKS